MAKIYKVPGYLKKAPATYWSSTYKEEIDKYIKRVKQFCKLHHSEEEIGEVLTFSVADGLAYYMVYCCKPLKLLHLPIGNCWEFAHVDKLTLKDVKQKLASQKALNRFFTAKALY